MLLTTRLAALFLLLSTVACHSPSVLLQENRASLAKARVVSQAFHERYGAELGLDAAPLATLGYSGGAGYHFNEEHEVLFLTPISHADFDVQRLFAEVAPEGRDVELYDELMFRYFAAHELMHLVYLDLPGVVEQEFDYHQEMEIHTMTWLFLQEARLLPDDEAEVLGLLANIEGHLARRFPGVMEGTLTLDELPLVDNPTYWFVTAASLQEARRLADAAGSSGRFLASRVETPYVGGSASGM